MKNGKQQLKRTKPHPLLSPASAPDAAIRAAFGSSSCKHHMRGYTGYWLLRKRREGFSQMCSWFTMLQACLSLAFSRIMCRRQPKQG